MKPINFNTNPNQMHNMMRTYRMDENSDASNNAIERSTEAKCHVVTVGDWKISQCIDNSLNIYHSILNDTILTLNHQKY